MPQHRPSHRLSRRFPLLARLLLQGLVSLLAATGAYAYTLYGFEDRYGIVHLSESKLAQAYVLIYEGETEPALGFPEIKRLLRQKAGAVEPRDEAWFKENVLRGSRRLSSGQSAGAWARDPATVDREIMASIKLSARKYSLDPHLLYAVIEQESNFMPRAVSPQGAEGIMQLMPEAQRFFGLDDPFSAAKNIDAGSRYLRYLLDKFASVPLALAAYNAGPALVERLNAIPPYPETQLYVERVLQRSALLKKL